MEYVTMPTCHVVQDCLSSFQFTITSDGNNMRYVITFNIIKFTHHIIL
jgi:hypothetical protein